MKLSTLLLLLALLVVFTGMIADAWLDSSSARGVLLFRISACGALCYMGGRAKKKEEILSKLEDWAKDAVVDEIKKQRYTTNGTHK